MQHPKTVRSTRTDVFFLSQVAKDVSIRLHSQLDTIEKKRSRLEQENEELRVRLQDLEVAKQVLQQEIDKVRSRRRLNAAEIEQGWDKKEEGKAALPVKQLCYPL